MGVVPRINERSAFTIWVAMCFFLIGVLQFGERSVFSHDFGGKIIGGNFFSLTTRRTFTFRQQHGQMIDQSGWVKAFEGEDAVKKGKIKRYFVSVTLKESA